MVSSGLVLCFRAINALWDPWGIPKAPGPLGAFSKNVRNRMLLLRLLFRLLGRVWSRELHQRVGLEKMVPKSTDDGTRLPWDAMKSNVKECCRESPL